MNAQIQISYPTAIRNLKIMLSDVDKAYNAAVNTRIRGERPSERAMRLAQLLEEKASLEMAIAAIEEKQAVLHAGTEARLGKKLPPFGY